MKIHFVRHAEADYKLQKKPGEFPGVPLTKCGKKQAKELSYKLRDFKYDFIFCSDMRRAKETIHPSLPYLAKKPVYDSRLREISDTAAYNPGNSPAFEPNTGQIQKIESFLELLKSLDGEILIVAHFGVIEYLSERLGKKICSPEYAGHYVLVLN